MKNMHIKKLLFAMVTLLCSVAASADRFEVDGIIYESKNDTEVWISSIDNENLPEGSITIPATVTNSGMTYSVTAIGDYAFYDCSNRASIEIPNSVTKIGQNAFEKLSSLTSIVIPKGVKRVDLCAFERCNNLHSITLPVGVNKIDENAFHNCNGIQAIYVPAKKTDYYKQRLNCNLHDKIVEIESVKL